MLDPFSLYITHSELPPPVVVPRRKKRLKQLQELQLQEELQLRELQLQFEQDFCKPFGIRVDQNLSKAVKVFPKCCLISNS
ncbi:hypothetical protein MSG28_008163 [Choristoneura fumiferana]|uniref:Uncharacterized protein n=1 Tax=Choristoneura fumiferana TaxID=7141 RepID=A0ACC0JAJ7_CHOFU|nr:hypothetical protein MSG28_008163 [Choristoneura fumiferana]